MSNSRDYYRVAEIIDYLRAHQASQPGLADLARHAGMSEAHLQRLFRRWAGISPKRFLQHLTLQRANAVLQDGGTVLAAADAAGLSGGGRLHDLLVHCEAVTPGEAQQGEALRIRHGFADTPFGEALLGQTGRGLCFLAFRDPDNRASMLADLQSRWPRAQFEEDAAASRQLATEIFSQDPGSTLPLHLRGTNFQIQVWRALLDIPEGQTTTYGRIARALGKEKASRAVGSAVGANPVSWIIPCHRVLRSDGGLGGYRWGTQRKEIMLTCEALREVTCPPHPKA